MTMREILFRGKRWDRNVWIYGGIRKVGGCYEIDAEHGPRETVFRDTVGQFTGLTDKNGKKIFEGDVLRFYSDYTNEFTGDPCIARYGEFNCTCCDGVYGWYFEGGDIRDHNLYVVIGNIYDNGELIQGGQMT